MQEFSNSGTEITVYKNDLWESFVKKYRENMKSIVSKPILIIEDNNNVVLAKILMTNINNSDDIKRIINISRMGFVPHAYTLVLDASFAKFEKGVFSSTDELKSNLKKEDLKSCMISLRYEKEKDVQMKIMPYTLKENVYSWDDSLSMNANENKVEVNSFLSSLGFLEKDTELTEKVDNKFLSVIKDNYNSEEEFIYNTRRLCISYLTAKKLFVADFVTKTHPEWTNCKEVADSIVNNMFTEGLITKGFLSTFKEFCAKYVGTLEYKEEFKKMVENNPGCFPKDIINNLDKFIEEFESQFFQVDEQINMMKEAELHIDNYIKLINVIKITPLKPNCKVKLIDNLTRKESEATYIGDVLVYLAINDNGNVLYSSEPEINNPELPEGYKVFTQLNPKFDLGNGKFYYGCNCYYEVQE